VSVQPVNRSGRRGRRSSLDGLADIRGRASTADVRPGESSDPVEVAVRQLVKALRDEFHVERRPVPAGLDPMVTMADAAAILGIHRASVYRLIESGGLVSRKVGRRRMIVASSLRGIVSDEEPAMPAVSSPSSMVETFRGGS
jgi:excisionase family DNA binding protein